MIKLPWSVYKALIFRETESRMVTLCSKWRKRFSAPYCTTSTGSLKAPRLQLVGFIHDPNAVFRIGLRRSFPWGRAPTATFDPIQLRIHFIAPSTVTSTTSTSSIALSGMPKLSALIIGHTRSCDSCDLQALLLWCDDPIQPQNNKQLTLYQDRQSCRLWQTHRFNSYLFFLGLPS